MNAISFTMRDHPCLTREIHKSSDRSVNFQIRHCRKVLSDWRDLRQPSPLENYTLTMRALSTSRTNQSQLQIIAPAGANRQIPAARASEILYLIFNHHVKEARNKEGVEGRPPEAGR